MSAQLDTLLARLGALTGAWSPQTPLDAMRAGLDAFFSTYPPAAQSVFTRAEPSVRGEWAETPECIPGRLLLLLHGGGYMMGSSRAHRAYASHLAQATRARVLTLDYRLAPEHRCPAALDDAQAAYGWLCANTVPSPGIVVCGDSAGGGLALSLALRLRDAGAAQPRAVVLVSPWLDLGCTGRSYAENAAIDPIVSQAGALAMAQTYLDGQADTDVPEAAPLQASLAGLPPMLVLVGEREVMLDDSRRLAERVEAAGGSIDLRIWPGMVHQFALHVGVLDESAQAVAAIGDFVRRQCETSPGRPDRGR